MKNSVESMISIIQCYIHIRKNVEVKINITNFAQIRKLEHAYDIATVWLKEYNFKIYGKT